MVLVESLGKEISDYIKSALNKEVSVIDESGKLTVSPDAEKIGRKPRVAVFLEELSSPQLTEIDNTQQIIVPLRYLNQNSAYLVISDTTPEALNYANIIKSFGELFIQQYYENAKPKMDATDQYFARVFGEYNPALTKQYEAEASALGYDVSVPRLAISLYLKGFWDNCLLSFDQPSFERDEVIKTWKRNIERSFNSFFTKNADLIIAYVGNDRFVIYKAVDDDGEEKVRKLLKKSFKSIFEPLKSHRIDSITAAFGNAYSGIEGLVSARRESDLTLELGQRIWGPNQSFYFGDLGILTILGDGDRDKKMTFSDQILNRLHNPELRKTLECFFDNNLNLTDTAMEMGIHRNTVIYRLNQITKVLNADPRVFEQAMSIKIALIIKSLFG